MHCARASPDAIRHAGSLEEYSPGLLGLSGLQSLSFHGEHDALEPTKVGLRFSTVRLPTPRCVCVAVEAFKQKLQKQIGAASANSLMCHDHPDDLDTGSVLWGAYNETMSTWVALPRMNAVNLDPLYYGVYGRDGVALVYHEGTGTTQRSVSKVHPHGAGGDVDTASRNLRDAVAAAMRFLRWSEHAL